MREHVLSGAYEPPGSHGMSLRRYCLDCGEVFSVQTPDEQVPSECRGRRTGKHPALAMPYGSGGAGEPSESSSSPSQGAGWAGTTAWPSGTLRVTLERVDGLSVTRILDGAHLDGLRWPDIFVRNTFDRMLADFRRAEEDNSGR